LVCYVIYKYITTLENQISLDRTKNYMIKHRSLLHMEQKLTFRSFLEFIVVYSNEDTIRDEARMAIERKYYLL
jgi:hypothetical protein